MITFVSWDKLKVGQVLYTKPRVGNHHYNGKLRIVEINRESRTVLADVSVGLKAHPYRGGTKYPETIFYDRYEMYDDEIVNVYGIWSGNKKHPATRIFEDIKVEKPKAKAVKAKKTTKKKAKSK